MKFLSRLLMAFAVIFSLTVAHIIPAKASSAPGLTLNPAESFVRTALLSTGKADLLEFSKNQSDDVLRSEFIVQLWSADPDIQKLSNFEIDNAVIQGDIKAEGLNIPFNVELQTCTFNGGIDLASATTKTFRIDGSTVTGEVKLGRMVVSGDLALYQSTFESGVTLFGADINKNLFARGSQFNADTPVQGSAFPFELWTTHVGQTTEFTGSVFKGEVKVDNAKLDGDVRFNDAVFEKPASFRNMQVGNIANFQSAQFKNLADFDSVTIGLDSDFGEVLFGGKANFANTKVGNIADFQYAKFTGLADFNSSTVELDAKFDQAIFYNATNFSNTRVGNKADFENVTFDDEVDFESSVMDRDIAFTGSTFNGKGVANFDYIAVTRFFDFDHVTLNKDFSFQYSTVGWPYFSETTFNRKVDFEGMQAGNDFDFTDAAYMYADQPFKVYLAKVDGRALFTGFQAPAGMDLSNSQFGELTIEGKEDNSFKVINLDSTKVDGNLAIKNAKVEGFSAKALTVGGSTIFAPMRVSGDIDMSNSNLGVLTMEDTGFWTTTNSSFDLHGMTFTDLGFVTKKGTQFKDAELDKNTKNLLSDMLNRSVYSPQVYQTMEQFLTEKGHPDWAADVEVARKVRERDHFLEKGSASWLWSWFLFLFSGYGQRPIYALGWSVAIILLGAWFFNNEADFNALDRGEDKPKFNPYFYSLALFIPFFEFGFDKNWEPKATRTTILIYKQIHRLLGWIVAPIALLAFSGILK